MTKEGEMEDQEKLLDFFCRHLVSLTWYEGHADANGEATGEPAFCMASGFVLEAAEEFWLVTAGHVFEDFESRSAEHGTVAFLPRIVDLWGSNVTGVHASPLPFSFFDEDVTRVALYKPKSGLDFALVRIPYLIREALSATITPFRRVDWINQDQSPFDKIILLGTPDEFKVQHRWENRDKTFIQSRLWPVGLILAGLDSSEVNLGETAFPQFVGQISPDAAISNIQGMSGGPILGVRFQSDGSVRYYPLAVQSRWLRQRRIVIGTLVSVIGGMTELYLSESDKG